MTALTESEEIVMKSVWELGGSCTLSQIMSQAKTHGKAWKLQTVATFLKNIQKKGFVEPYRDGRFLHYKVLISENEYKREKIRELIDFWNEGNAGDFVRSLFQEKVLSKKERKTVRSLLYESVD